MTNIDPAIVEAVETHDDYAPPCEFVDHRGGEPAAWIVWYFPAPCGHRPSEYVLFCSPCWESRRRALLVHCAICGFDNIPAGSTIKRVEPL